MQAIVYERYGSPDVMQLREIAQPVPRAGEVLVKVHAASVNMADWHLLTADIFLVRLAAGLFKPKRSILGIDVAGRVETVGAGSRRFQPGDAVFGDLFPNHGSFAEYVAVPESILETMPVNLSFAQAAAVPLAAMTALQGLRLGRIAAGQRVLINGASGGVGSFTVQLAKYFGAEVTAVCSSGNVEQARILGADQVIDYKREDFTTAGRQYDLIVAPYSAVPLSAYRRVLSPRGRYVMIGGQGSLFFQLMVFGPLLSKKGGQTFSLLSAKGNAQDLAFLKELLAAGKLRPVIDRHYPLAQTAEALRYLGAGHARGKVVIDVVQEAV